MEKIVRQGKLFDYYGGLLTEHQQAIYTDAVFENMSLTELAETYDISRQAAHDLIKRCDAKLKEYEEKLHLVEKIDSISKMAVDITQTCEYLSTQISRENFDKADCIEKLRVIKDKSETIDTTLWE